LLTFSTSQGDIVDAVVVVVVVVFAGDNVVVRHLYVIIDVPPRPAQYRPNLQPYNEIFRHTKKSNPKNKLNAYILLKTDIIGG